MPIQPGAIVDIHHHIRLQPHSTRHYLAKDYDSRVRILDRDGVDQAIVTPSNGFQRPRGLEDTRRINDQMAEYVTRYQDRFPVGMGVVLPLQGEESVGEMERCVRELGLRGFDWHHMSLGAPIDHPMMYLFMEEIRRLKAVAFIHAFAESMWEAPWRLEKLAGDFPEVPVVTLSGLCMWSYLEAIVRIALRLPNIFVDTFVFPTGGVSGADEFPVEGGFIEYCVSKLGPERILYGSDVVAEPSNVRFWHSFSLQELRLSTTISPEQKSLILGENARRLFANSN